MSNGGTGMLSGARRWAWRSGAVAVGIGLVVAALPLAPAVEATSSADPYTIPQVIDRNADPTVVETRLVAAPSTVTIERGVGGLPGRTANVFAYNGTVPGPEFRVAVGQKVIVHFENRLPVHSGIHWHGIELANANDGTSHTQNAVPPGGTFLYQLIARRPGVFAYHPHHHGSTNQTFKGLYGTIVVTDPNEAALIGSGVLPSPSQTLTLALSDITVCKASGSNDDPTYDLSLPHASGNPLVKQPEPTPRGLCETPLDESGNETDEPLNAGDVPNIQDATPARFNEGQTVLTNGMNVGHRGGRPGDQGHLAPDAFTYDVRPGQGLRLRLANLATTRYFRLSLRKDISDSISAVVPLVRVGGEGGLLNDAMVEGCSSGFNYKYVCGEVVLAPGDRADVVAAIPGDATGVLSLWTRDFQRIGLDPGWADIPDVPAAHFRVNGTAVVPNYTISDGTPLRTATGNPIQMRFPSGATLLDPAAFATPKPGMAGMDITLTAANGSSGINDIRGDHEFTGDYTAMPHPASARYAVLGETIPLRVINQTKAHHPFHLHGFSIQPHHLTTCKGQETATLLFPPEYVDNVDIPPGCTLTLMLHLEDRPLSDGVTPGGGLGRWAFHCHIFAHATHGMISELVVVSDATGNEKPNLDAGTSSGAQQSSASRSAARFSTAAPAEAEPIIGVTVAEGQPASFGGTFSDPDAGDVVTLASSTGSVTDNGNGTWTWNYTPPDGGKTEQIYITATDDKGNRNQTSFTLVTTNVAPTVAVDPAQVTSIDEGRTVSVRATFSDPGILDTFVCVFTWGAPAGREGVVVSAPTVEITDPGGTGVPLQGVVTATYRYGDNDAGSGFPITIAVTDKDGGVGSTSLAVTVANIAPSPAIDTTGLATIGGAPTIVAHTGDPLSLGSLTQDPGSDDLAFSWQMGDGTTLSATSLVNPPSPDPPLSPTVQPRNGANGVNHTFVDACLYQAVLTVTDDDGGVGTHSVAVLITGPATSATRTAGYWSTEYGGSKRQLTEKTLDCYLDIVAAISQVFSEKRALSTFQDASTILDGRAASGNARTQLDRQLLAAWLNFANGAFDLDEVVDANGDGVTDTAFWDVLRTAESVRLNATATKQQLLDQKNILERLNQSA